MSDIARHQILVSLDLPILHVFLQLYNVVVDTEQTGKKLLQHGDLKRRYTIIPLNKISARSIPGDVVHRAEGLVSMQISRQGLTVFTKIRAKLL